MISLAVKSWVIASEGKCFDHNNLGYWALVVPEMVNNMSSVEKKYANLFIIDNKLQKIRIVQIDKKLF